MKHRDKPLWIFPRIATVFLLLFGAINTVPAQTVLPAEDIAEKALRSTVYLEMKDKNDKTLGIGSGFFVKRNIIATNYHVIEGAAKGTARVVDRFATYNIEGITAIDKMNDLALLKVTAYGIEPLTLGDSDTVRIGETVYVAGYPKGLEGTFSDGIISSRRDQLTEERLQMTAPISPGSSGGPVLNRKGEVIGVSVSVHRALDAQNLNFAIPAKHLKELLAQSKSAKPLSQEKPVISAETYFKWGNAKYELEDYVGAIAGYSMAIQLKPDLAEAYVNRGVAKADLGQHVAAIVDYNIAIKINPNDAKAYNNRGSVKHHLGEYVAAIADCDIAIKINPNYADAYYNRGVVKADLGQNIAAIADYDNAIKINPDYADAYNNRGVAKADLGQNIAAIADYDNAIKINPNDAKAYNNRGIAKRRLGKYIAAIADYDNAIKINPDYADAYNNRGNVKRRLGKYVAAIADYNIAIKINPDFAEAYNNRGGAKAELGQSVAAIADYNIAIKIKPNYANAYYNRGIAKADLGRTEEARQDLQKALKLAEKAGNESLKAAIESTLKSIR